MLRGYASNYWIPAQKVSETHSGRKNLKSTVKWDMKLTQACLDLHKAIWDDRNTFVHGKDIKVNKEKARQIIHGKVRVLYANPPKLAPRYPPLTRIPLDDSLRRTTTQLNDWIHRVQHQIKMSEMIRTSRPPRRNHNNRFL